MYLLQLPTVNMIPTDISRIPGATSQEERSATHLIQAFATYDVVAGYCIDLISTARDCLQLWKGDEVKAFSLSVSLLGENVRVTFFHLTVFIQHPTEWCRPSLRVMLCADFLKTTMSSYRHSFALNDLKTGRCSTVDRCPITAQNGFNYSKQWPPVYEGYFTDAMLDHFASDKLETTTFH